VFSAKQPMQRKGDSHLKPKSKKATNSISAGLYITLTFRLATALTPTNGRSAEKLIEGDSNHAIAGKSTVTITVGTRKDIRDICRLRRRILTKGLDVDHF